MKKIIYATLTLLPGMLLAVSISLAGDKGPPEIILKSSLDPASRSKPAFFPHAIHQGNFPCAVCHHGKGEDGKQIPFAEDMKVEKCESCHNTASGMNPEYDTFKEAAHGRCKECHQKLSAEGKKAGPTKCNGCHRKDLE